MAPQPPRLLRRVLRAVVTAAALVLVAVLLAGWVLRGPAVRVSPVEGERRPVSAERLERSVRSLVGFGPRWYTPPEDLARVADWLRGELTASGLAVTEQRYRLREGAYRNVIGTWRGTDPARGVVIVGAHYDAYGKLPGADDNASGVAVLLELARTRPARPPRRTVLFVGFANEEPPLYASGDMGSPHFARRLVEIGTPVDLMLALDLVGYFSDEPGSQRLPASWMRLFYPTTGNFIGVVGDLGAGEWIGRVKRGLRAGATIPVFSFRAPRAIPGVDWSDHLWFRELGLPGVLVTDTAMMRNPHYHRRTDLPETLDYRRMAEVVHGLHGVLAEE